MDTNIGEDSDDDQDVFFDASGDDDDDDEPVPVPGPRPPVTGRRPTQSRARRRVPAMRADGRRRARYIASIVSKFKERAAQTKRYRFAQRVAGAIGGTVADQLIDETTLQQAQQQAALRVSVLEGYQRQFDALVKTAEDRRARAEAAGREADEAIADLFTRALPQVPVPSLITVDTDAAAVVRHAQAKKPVSKDAARLNDVFTSLPSTLIPPNDDQRVLIDFGAVRPSGAAGRLASSGADIETIARIIGQLLSASVPADAPAGPVNATGAGASIVDRFLEYRYSASAAEGNARRDIIMAVPLTIDDDGNIARTEVFAAVAGVDQLSVALLPDAGENTAARQLGISAASGTVLRDIARTKLRLLSVLRYATRAARVLASSARAGGAPGSPAASAQRVIADIIRPALLLAMQEPAARPLQPSEGEEAEEGEEEKDSDDDDDRMREDDGSLSDSGDELGLTAGSEDYTLDPDLGIARTLSDTLQNYNEAREIRKRLRASSPSDRGTDDSVAMWLDLLNVIRNIGDDSRLDALITNIQTTAYYKDGTSPQVDELRRWVSAYKTVQAGTGQQTDVRYGVYLTVLMYQIARVVIKAAATRALAILAARAQETVARVRALEDARATVARLANVWRAQQPQAFDFVARAGRGAGGGEPFVPYKAQLQAAIAKAVDYVCRYNTSFADNGFVFEHVLEWAAEHEAEVARRIGGAAAPPPRSASASGTTLAGLLGQSGLYRPSRGERLALAEFVQFFVDLTKHYMFEAASAARAIPTTRVQHVYTHATVVMDHAERLVTFAMRGNAVYIQTAPRSAARIGFYY